MSICLRKEGTYGRVEETLPCMKNQEDIGKDEGLGTPPCAFRSREVHLLMLTYKHGIRKGVEGHSSPTSFLTIYISHIICR